jgi:hypothetical protein
MGQPLSTQGSSTFWASSTFPVFPDHVSEGIAHVGIDRFFRKAVWCNYYCFVHITCLLEVLCGNRILSKDGRFFYFILKTRNLSLL